jgi:hypothetical protein
VEHYGLPPIPLKEKDKRAPSFRYRHGVDGGVELDALEALHPGELARLVRAAAEPWLDGDLEERLAEADTEADESLGEQWEAETADLREQLDALGSRATKIMDRYRETLKQVRQLNNELQPLRDELRELKTSIKDRLDQVDFELDARPEPEEPDVDTDGMLYDSRRTWLDQLPYWQRHRNGDAQ